ncbi:MAG: hypothetical protein OEZ36_02055 [Spirochaetota bacterium]|nr:hypothetical protein [Spirochaetota bacterium]
MFKSDEENLQKELLALREENKQLKHKLADLEEIVSEQRETMDAQETVGELARAERLFAEATIDAYEKVIELSSLELKECQNTIDAHGNLREYSREKKVFIEATVAAYNKVLDLSKKELEDAFKTIDALENVNELARSEISTLLDKVKKLTSKSRK